MNLTKYNYRKSKYNKSRILNCDKLRPENLYMNCVDVKGKLYSLSLKKHHSKRNKRLKIRSLRSEKYKFSNIFKRKSRRPSAKNTTDKGLMDCDVNMEPSRYVPPITNPMERISEAGTKNQPHKLETEKPRRLRGRPKNIVKSSSLIASDHRKENPMEINDEQKTFTKILKKVKLKVDDYLKDMKLAAAFRKQQKKSQLQVSRRKLGLAKQRQLGRSKKDSSKVKERQMDEQSVVIQQGARLQGAKLKKDQQLLERNVQEDKKKLNSRISMDWEKLDSPEKVKEPPIVLRRSARIQAAKLKKETLEANMRKSRQEKVSTTTKTVSKPRITQLAVCRLCPNCNSINYLSPPYSKTYFECADINGRLYKLN